MQVFYRRLSECNLVDILGLHDPQQYIDYGVWFFVFCQFVCLFFCTVFFSRIELLSKTTTKKSSFDQQKVESASRVQTSCCALFSPHPPFPIYPVDSPSLTTRRCHMFKACDLLSYIVWYTCTHVINVKRYCIVSKCFANTLVER